MGEKKIKELLDEYFRECEFNQDQHEFIFNFMIPTMSEILDDISDVLIPAHHKSQAEEFMFINEVTPTLDAQGNYIQDVPWDWDNFYQYLSMVGLQNTSAFHLEIGVREPADNQSPRYRNFIRYSNEYGRVSFKKECDD